VAVGLFSEPRARSCSARSTEVLLPELTYPIIQDYLTSLVPPREPEMQAMEAHADKIGFPIIGPVAGSICYQISRLIRAHTIFEMGSGFGYSTAWFAKALRDNGGGAVHHVVWDEKLSQMARQSLSRLGLDGLVDYHVAEAVETLRKTPGPFDIIFNDIDKQDYPAALPVIKEKLRHGGVLIIDNALWHGRIFDETDRSPATNGVRKLTRLITHDSDWIVSLIPVRDGLLLAYRQ
jgi:caffeoyl-CoA O-methyltransferase